MASRRREVTIERECARVTIDAVKNGVLISTGEHGLVLPFAIAKSGRELEAVLRSIHIRPAPSMDSQIESSRQRAAAEMATDLGTPIFQATPTEPLAAE